MPTSNPAVRKFDVGVAPKDKNPARGGQGEQTLRSPASTLEAARLNAECGWSKRRVTRYECEPPILKRDTATLKLQEVGLKCEATSRKREGRHLKRKGWLLKREARRQKRKGRRVKREGRCLKRKGWLLKRKGRHLKRQGWRLKREGRLLKREARRQKRKGRRLKREGCWGDSQRMSNVEYRMLNDELESRVIQNSTFNIHHLIFILIVRLRPSSPHTTKVGWPAYAPVRTFME